MPAKKWGDWGEGKSKADQLFNQGVSAEHMMLEIGPSPATYVAKSVINNPKRRHVRQRLAEKLQKKGSQIAKEEERTAIENKKQSLAPESILHI